MLLPLALGFLLGGTTAGIILAFLWSRSIHTLAAEHHTRQKQAYAQGYQDRALLGLQPPSGGNPTRTRPRSRSAMQDTWPACTQSRAPLDSGH